MIQKILNYNKINSKEECPINNNNESSNSKTPVSIYDINNKESHSTTFNNKYNSDGKPIKITKHKENDLVAKKKVPWLVIKPENI